MLVLLTGISIPQSYRYQNSKASTLPNAGPEVTLHFLVFEGFCQ